MGAAMITCSRIPMQRKMVVEILEVHTALPLGVVRRRAVGLMASTPVERSEFETLCDLLAR